MNVSQAKAFVRAASNDDLLTTYRQLKREQYRLSISRMTASLRVTDRLYRELVERGLLAPKLDFIEGGPITLTKKK